MIKIMQEHTRRSGTGAIVDSRTACSALSAQQSALLPAGYGTGSRSKPQ